MSNDNDKKLDRIFDKLDVMDMRIDAIDKTLVLQESSLREHMRRSDNLEKLMEHIQKDFKPIQKHVNMVEGIMKFLGLVSLLGGITLSVMQILGLL